MVEQSSSPRRAFITCSARAVGPVWRLMSEVEQVLLDAGWRTRLPGRLDADSTTSLEERRRLARAAREDVARASVVIHVPAPRNLAGATLHRELAHAVRMERPVLLAVLARERERLLIGQPDPDRLGYLARSLGAPLVEDLTSLVDMAESVARPLPD